MLENGSKIKLDETFLRKKRSDAKSASLFKGFKNLYFLIGIITGFIILCLMFFLSSYSNIYHISVKGNYYLTDSDVLRLSGLTENNKYFFTSTNMSEKRMLKSPYFDSVKVKKLDDQVVEIDVCEKKQIAYPTIGSYHEIIFVDGTNVEINDSNKYLMSKLPEMTGFTSEQLNTVLRGFKNIDQKTINEISEINRYSFSYDENMMEVIMKDGNICFVSWTGLSMLDKYYSIVSGLDTSMGNVCIYLDELTNSGYVSICPWQE